MDTVTVYRHIVSVSACHFRFRHTAPPKNFRFLPFSPKRRPLAGTVVPRFKMLVQRYKMGTKLDPNPYPLGSGPPNPNSLPASVTSIPTVDFPVILHRCPPGGPLSIPHFRIGGHWIRFRDMGIRNFGGRGTLSITVQCNGHCSTSIHTASSCATRWGTKLDPNPYPSGVRAPQPQIHFWPP